MSNIQLVFCNVPTFDIAQDIASQLLAKRLCACVNILPKVTSLYLWEGKIVEDNEVALLLKTTCDKYSHLESFLKELHPYEIPEIIALDIQNGLLDYLNWVQQTVV